MTVSYPTTCRCFSAPFSAGDYTPSISVTFLIGLTFLMTEPKALPAFKPKLGVQ